MLTQKNHGHDTFYYDTSTYGGKKPVVKGWQSSRRKERLGVAVWIAGGVLVGSVLWLMAALLHAA